MKYEAGDTIYGVKELNIIPRNDHGIVICNKSFKEPEDYVNGMIFLDKYETIELAKALVEYIATVGKQI